MIGGSIKKYQEQTMEVYSVGCMMRVKQDKYINAYDMLIGSCLYNIQWGCGSEENLVRGQIRKP